MKTFKTHLLITTSLKGGGGKSTLACALVDYLRNRKTPVAAYDADGSIGSLSDMHATRNADGLPTEVQEPLTGVTGYNIRDESRNMLIDSLSHQYPLVVHDAAGGSLAEIQRVFDEENSLGKFVRSLEALGTKMVLLHLITPDTSTIESMLIHMELTDRLGELAAHTAHVAVLNRYGNRKDADFPHWFGYTDSNGKAQGGKTRARLFAGGGAEMSLPALNDRTMAILKSLQIPFVQAVHNSHLTMVDQQRIKIFREDFAAAMSPEICALLGVAS